MPSYSDTEYDYNDVHRLILPSNSAAAISGVVPVAVGGRVQSSSVLLHNHSCHDVLERFSKFCELRKTLLHDGGCPLVDSIVDVVVLSDNPIHSLLYDLGNLVSHERALLRLLVIIHGIYLPTKVTNT